MAVQVTIQRPDGRMPYGRNWVPLAWDVPVTVEDAGDVVTLRTAVATGVEIGCRVLLPDPPVEGRGKAAAYRGLLVVRVDGEGSGPWTIATVPEQTSSERNQQ